MRFPRSLSIPNLRKLESLQQTYACDVSGVYVGHYLVLCLHIFAVPEIMEKLGHCFFHTSHTPEWAGQHDADLMAVEEANLANHFGGG